MLRVSKLTDYATVVMTCLARRATACTSAQALAERARLELPTVSKLLKQLAQAGLVASTRGINGGYRLARAPERITIADIVTAMEGPIGMTECSAHAGACDHEPHCGVRVNWQRINRRSPVRWRDVTLADMLHPPPKPRASIPARRRPQRLDDCMATERIHIENDLRDHVPTPDAVAAAISRRYDAGFVTDIETETLPPGLGEDVVRAISARKNEPEWMTEWRLKAYRHWLTMTPPHWAKLSIEPIDFQAISYFAAPKNRPKSLDEVDPKLLETYDKLGVPLHERARLAGVAVDAVFDSVSVGTTFRKELAEAA